MGGTAIGLLPSWVEADPLRGRAVDALGLQATADRIADLLVPGLTGATTRARYFSFLAWARRASGPQADEFPIHRLEVALAIRESKLHAGEAVERDNGDGRCRFVGSRNLRIQPRDRPPAEPRQVYRVPAWRAYRAPMQSLDLLEHDYALTSYGDALAKAWSAVCKGADASGTTMLPPLACLLKLSRPEASLLVARLGLWRKGRRRTDDTSAEGRRDALERELQDYYAERYPLPVVLGAYETRREREPSRTVSALREAAVWERLSVGLHAVFLLWLSHLRSPGIVKQQLATARRARRIATLEFADIDIKQAAAVVTAVQSVRRALDRHDRLAPRGQLEHCDASAFELGEALVGREAIDKVFERFEKRHHAAKGDDAWIRHRGHAPELVRDRDRKWQLPSIAKLHPYRLSAFASIQADLRRA
jgi:hypothetical protein